MHKKTPCFEKGGETQALELQTTAHLSAGKEMDGESDRNRP